MQIANAAHLTPAEQPDRIADFYSSLSVITERLAVRSPGWADGCSAVLIDVAQGFGGEVGECGVAVDGHDEVSFREGGAQDVDDAVSAAECEAVGVGAPLPSLIMPPSAQARPPYAGQH